MPERHWTETKDEGGMLAYGTQDVQVLGLGTLGILNYLARDNSINLWLALISQHIIWRWLG